MVLGCFLLKGLLLFLSFLNASSAQPIATCNNCCRRENHKEIDNSRRSVQSQWKWGQTPLCDKDLSQGWYRFKSFVGGQIPTQRVNMNHCGTMAPIWLDGTHPGPDDPVARVKACVNLFERRQGCFFSFYVSIKNCGGRFYLYFLQPTSICYTAYCAGKKVYYLKSTLFWHDYSTTRTVLLFIFSSSSSSCVFSLALSSCL